MGTNMFLQIVPSCRASINQRADLALAVEEFSHKSAGGVLALPAASNYVGLGFTTGALI